MKSFETLVTATARAAMRDNSQIQKVISRIVPAQTLAHIEFCRLEGGRLRVTVDSAAWVARFRFMERQIIGELKTANRDVHTISYHVSPAQKTTPRKTHRTAIGSTAGAASLEAAAVEAAAVDTAAVEAAAVDTASTDTHTVEEGDDTLRQQLLKLAASLRNA